MSGKELRAFLRVTEGTHDEVRAGPAIGDTPPPVFFVSIADKGLTLAAAR
jgi:hypothetical protein